jgi:hypothetical protein
MNRLFLLGGLLALAAFSSVRAEDEKDRKEEKVPTIQQVMKTAHGKTAFQGQANAALKARDFDKLSRIAKDWEKSAVALSKNKPRKGEQDSWDMLTAGYLKNIKALGEGVGKKDEEAITRALKFVNTTCTMCHLKHK